jgi:hypothetical protein
MLQCGNDRILLRPAGAPAANSTFFCNYEFTKCYSHSFMRSGQQAAAEGCLAVNGELVAYQDAAEQELVERYFGAWDALSRSYWLGMRRPGPGASFTLLDGTPLPQRPSASPYAHWDYNQPVYAGRPGYDCVAAWQDTAYSAYTGSSTAALQLRDPAYYGGAMGAAAAGGAAGSAFARGGWAAYECNATLPHVCMILAEAFPLPEPPLPPAQPPEPPSPPSPPLPPSCAPSPSDTFFCDSSGACYTYQAALATMPKARQRCAERGGDLVQYGSGPEQLKVEAYFAQTGALSGYYYWIGAHRAARGFPFTSTGGEELPQQVSSDPYGHWARYHAQVASGLGYDCVLAVNSYKYDAFVGDAFNADSVLRAANYLSTDDDKYGWAAAICTGTYSSICEANATAFPCYPPPSPPPPPPQPPSPPSPPLPPSCAPAANATFFCSATTCYRLLHDGGSFDQALAKCAALAPGATLVQYKAEAGEQLAVELYFRSKGPLQAYWTGLYRNVTDGDDASTPAPEFAFLDGDPAPQAASMLYNLPYAHWAWEAADRMQQRDLGCVSVEPYNAYDRWARAGTCAWPAPALLCRAGTVALRCAASKRQRWCCKRPPAPVPAQVPGRPQRRRAAQPGAVRGQCRTVCRPQVRLAARVLQPAPSRRVRGAAAGHALQTAASRVPAAALAPAAACAPGHAHV